MNLHLSTSRCRARIPSQAVELFCTAKPDTFCQEFPGDEKMRASRLLSILMLLQTNGRMTAQALAERLEVSVRTVYRDIDDLSAAGVPVYADRGPSGGFALLDGYRTRLTGLSPAEASALVLSGLPGPATQLGLAELLSAAQLKLAAALPAPARESASRVSARFHLDPADWFRTPSDTKLLPAIAEAVWNETELRLHYCRPTGTIARTIHPLGLVLKGGAWYLVAERDGQVRTYRVARIIDLSPTGQRFERPASFDLVAFWTDAARSYERHLYHGTATLRVSPRGMTRWRLFPSAVAEAAAATAGPPEPDDWVQVQIPIEAAEEAAHELLRLGTEAEVLEPAGLRQRLASIAHGLAALYGGGEPNPSAAKIGIDNTNLSAQ